MAFIPDKRASAAPRTHAKGLTLTDIVEGRAPTLGVRDDSPLPLFQPLAAAEQFPMNALGSTLASAAKAIASKVQVPEAIAAQSVLAVASLAACSHADVLLPYGQARPLALFFMTVAASGDRKSTADNEALRPVYDHEKNLRDEFDAAVKNWWIEHVAWTAEKRKIENNRQLDFSGRKKQLTALGDEPKKPLSPFRIVNDLTVEGLTKNWPDAHAALGVFTAEGGVFTAGHAMNDDNRLKTAAMLSELWDGKTVKRVRALDGITILAGRRLSMHVMLQPHAAGSFLSSAVLRDQGLLSRILVAHPESLVGTRLYREPQDVDLRSIDAYAARLLAVFEEPAALSPNSRNQLQPRPLPLSPDARGHWIAFHDHVERQCSKQGELAAIRDFAAKAAEHAARIAGVLTIIANTEAQEIGAGEMHCALAIADWYVAEAARLQQAGVIDSELRRAAELLDWLKAQPRGEATFREILRCGPNQTRTKVEAENALTVLASHRLIVEVSQRPRTIGAVEMEMAP